jgi:hypothetical protein
LRACELTFVVLALSSSTELHATLLAEPKAGPAVFVIVNIDRAVENAGVDTDQAPAYPSGVVVIDYFAVGKELG